MTLENTEPLIGDAGSKRYSAAGIDVLLAWIPAMIVGSAVREHGVAASAVAFTVIFLGYFLFAEGIWSTTVGKAFMGLRVTTLDGTRPTVMQIFLRNVLRLLDANPVLLGAIPGAVFIMFTRRRQRLGDLVARTIVVIPPK